MAHMKDLNLQMKIQAERIRLQSRDIRKAGNPGSANETVVMNKMGKTHIIAQNRPSTSSNRGVSSKASSVLPTTPSKIPVRKPASGVSALKGKANPGVAAVKRGELDTKHVHFGTSSSRPADYTWHKAGRIQEIRTRYIARKFFHLWVSACFGKVGPQRIREHHRKQLLRKVWGEWHDLWWVNRREWRLQVRAQYHYRYCMTRKVWQAWLQYVVRQKVLNAKTNVADEHANTKLVQSTFTAWKQYMTYRNVKKKNFGNAYRIADTRRLSQAWQLWRDQIQERQDRDSMQQHALQYWADGLVYKSWMIWRSRLAAIAEMKRREEVAVELYHRSLLARCFYQGLMPYVLHRRDRTQDKGVASQFYISHLIQKSFSHWHTSWFTRRSLALRGQQIDAMAQQARLRRAWIHWQFYVHLQHIEAAKTALAIRHYQEKLLTHGLHAFHTAVALHKLKDIRKEKADEMRYNVLLRWSWNSWLQGCEHKEELRIYVQSRKARNHYKSVLFSRVIHGWLQYTRWRQHRHAQYIKADAHHVSRLLPKCLRSFQMFAQIMRDKRFNQEQAVTFRRECLLGFFFTYWYHSYQISMDVRMMQRMAIMHYDHNVAQRMLITWKHRTTLQLQQHAKEDMAVEHFEVHLKKGVIQSWKVFTAESTKRQSQEHKAARHHYNCMLRKGWQAWKQFVAHQQLKCNKLLKADIHYRQRLLKQTLDGWKVYNRRMEQVYEVVKDKKETHNKATLRLAFGTWSENAQLQVEESRNVELAEHHHKTCLLKKIMVCWRQYAVLHAHKHNQKMDRLMQIRQQLDKGKICRAFRAWISYKDEALIQHLAERRANSHYQRRLLHKTIQQWVRYRQLEIRKTLLQRQCAWLHNTRITAKYFLRWRAQHHAEIAENNKTTIALWQWSLVLQQKVIYAWLQYVTQQRHKKQRITVAMEMRRQRLLREGVSQWLRVATDMEERRGKKAAQLHAQTAYRSYNIVKRCATNWRQKTLANRGKKSQQIPSQPSPIRILSQPSPVQQSLVLQRPVVRIGSIAVQPLDNRRPPNQPMPSMTAPFISHRAPSFLKQHMGTVDLGEPTCSRPKPRRPDFLMESLQREGLWKSVSAQDGYRYDEPISPQDYAMPNTSASDNEDDDAVDESLPRSQPPPPPSPQPKHLGQSSQMSQYRARKQDLPDVTESPRSDTDDFISKQYENRDENNRTSEMINAPLLMPPSAFTGTKSNLDTMSPSEHIPSNECKDIHSTIVDSDFLKQQQVLLQSNVVQDTHIGPISAISVVSGEMNDTPDSVFIPNDGTSTKHHLLSPDAFMSKETQDDVLSETNSEDSDKEQNAEDIYREILELKDQLLQYQQAKQKLGSLKEQHKHLSSWLTESETLDGDSGMQQTNDEDAETVRAEVNQIEVEMADLTTELDRRKPECAEILEKINILAKQIR